ncbi:ABC transporter permease [Burkholderia stagnalis]|uniref:ABC transporter permease n=1 Tax=Burkholderia stagnalis TaxID=1503054 RepID=UPI0021AB35CF|nr:ABC transporter permease [Burkholderia stagnalis]
MRNTRKIPGLRVSAWAFFLFLYAPIVVLVALSFNDGGSATVWQGFGLSGYVTVLRDGAAFEATRTSFAIAAISATASSLIAIPTALYLWNNTRRTAGFAGMLVTSPLLVPEIVLALGTLIVFSITAVKLNFWTVVFGHTVFCLPFAYLPIRGSLSRIDPTYLEAAADLGADRWRVFRHIVWPLIRTGVAAGFALAFVVSIDDFVTTYFLSGTATTTLPMYIYGLITRGVKPNVNALATIVLVFSFGAALLSVWLSRAANSEKQLSILEQGA